MTTTWKDFFKAGQPYKGIFNDISDAALYQYIKSTIVEAKGKSFDDSVKLDSLIVMRAIVSAEITTPLPQNYQAGHYYILKVKPTNTTSIKTISDGQEIDFPVLSAYNQIYAELQPAIAGDGSNQPDCGSGDRIIQIFLGTGSNNKVIIHPAGTDPQIEVDFSLPGNSIIINITKSTELTEDVLGSALRFKFSVDSPASLTGISQAFEFETSRINEMESQIVYVPRGKDDMPRYRMRLFIDKMLLEQDNCQSISTQSTYSYPA